MDAMRSAELVFDAVRNAFFDIVYGPGYRMELLHVQALNRQDAAAEKRRRIAARLAEIRRRTRMEPSPFVAVDKAFRSLLDAMVDESLGTTP